MTAPSSRLLFWAAWLVLPLGIISASAPGLTLACLAVLLLAVLIGLADLALGLRRPLGLEIRFPEVIRFARMRPAVLAASLVQDASIRRARRLRIGIIVPAELGVEAPVLSIALPSGPGQFTAHWDCTPLERGRFRVEHARVETPSPLGLWSLRYPLAVQTEVRVYPNLIPERNRMAAMFLNREGAGIHAQRQVGKGREFEQLRDYLPGDSYEDIHWKATARRGHPVTKMFQIERTQEVYVVVDSSRLSARNIPSNETGGEPEPQLEHLLRAALLLGLVAEKQGDFFGLATFSDRVHTFIRASKGRGHFAQCREALCTLKPRLVNPDFEEMCTFLRLRLRRRALVVFLTNLDDPVLAESLTRNLDLLSNRHLVLVDMITGAHVQPIFSRGAVSSLDELYGHLGGHLQWQNLRETQRALHRRGVDMHLTGHENLCGDLVNQYVSVKQRQLL
jgi:uncharacterized protein (DUF58 family)